MTHDAAWARHVQQKLRQVLNAWDPFGVAPGGESGAPIDEYDFIRDPLISRLLSGGSREEIARFLREELPSGLDPGLVTPALLEEIFSCWETVR